jgi:hypothetical protein
MVQQRGKTSLRFLDFDYFRPSPGIRWRHACPFFLKAGHAWPWIEYGWIHVQRREDHTYDDDNLILLWENLPIQKKSLSPSIPKLPPYRIVSTKLYYGSSPAQPTWPRMCLSPLTRGSVSSSPPLVRDSPHAHPTRSCTTARGRARQLEPHGTGHRQDGARGAACAKARPRAHGGRRMGEDEDGAHGGRDLGRGSHRCQLIP